MPRSKNDVHRISTDKNKLNDAISLIKEKKFTVYGAAKHFGLPKTTLKRHYNHCIETGQDVSDLHNHLSVNRVFTDKEEHLLVDYIKEAAVLKYGLTLKDVKKLAYNFAKTNNIKYPTSWDKELMAGDYWMRLFRKRNNNELSLRKPEATTFARSSALNENSVKMMFANYKNALSKHSDFRGIDIWNVDEIDLSTVHESPKILASKDVKQVGWMTSEERGNAVTMIVAVNAGGGVIPPMLIFPCVNIKDSMLRGAPDGTIGGANPSGWSNGTMFLQFFKHFINYVKPSKERPVILLLENHESHIQIPVIESARKHGIIVVTFPPHTSHNFRPLDRSVFGFFKKYYNNAANERMLTPGHIGKPLTIYDIPQIVGKAFPLAFSPSNIAQGFKSTGLYPLNENIFGEQEILPSNFTDWPVIDIKEQPLAGTSIPESNEVFTSFLQDVRDKSIMISPMIRPYSKVEQTKAARKSKRKGKPRFLSVSPEKN